MRRRRRRRRRKSRRRISKEAEKEEEKEEAEGEQEEEKEEIQRRSSACSQQPPCQEVGQELEHEPGEVAPPLRPRHPLIPRVHARLQLLGRIIGPGRCCSPHRRVASKSRNEG